MRLRVPNLLEGNSPSELMVAAGIAAGVLVLVWIVRTFAERKFRQAHLTVTQVDDFILDVARRTKIFLLFLPAIFLAARALELPRELSKLIRVGAQLSLIAQTALWASGVIDFFIRRYRRSRLESDPSAVTTVNAFRIAAVTAVWIFAVVVAIDNLGFNVSTLIAGLGIGGVAVALATQNILADLFASLSIVTDKPFVIGDTIAVDEHVGRVEHIGLKTTRLRALGGEELIFSNADMLKSRIRNFRGVTERRSLARLGVTYGTSPDTLARIPTILQAAVEKQQQARFDRAHFVAFGASGCEIELVYYVATTDYNEFLDIQQAVNLDVLRSFAAGGIEIAYPTQTLFVTKA